MIIRQETTSDASAVYELVKTAFASAEHSDGNEQDLVVLLHKSPSFQPALSLVAEENGKVIGYILFSEIKSEKNSHCSCATGSTARTAKKRRWACIAGRRSQHCQKSWLWHQCRIRQ